MGSSETRGTYQHFIPAAFLGRFSGDTSMRARRRPLWVASSDDNDSYEAPAASVGGEIGLYDVSDDSLGAAQTADVAWGYEQGLREALDALVENRDLLDGAVWLTKLVPFVAAMFVRGPEFQHEYPERLPRSLDKYGASDLDTATRARLIDFQVLLAPVMAARWAVVHFSEHVDLIASDRGYALTTTPTGDLPSYVLPVDRHAALVVTPQRSGQSLRWVRGRWVAELEHFTASDTEVRALNAAVAAHARRAIYGPSKEAVDGVSSHIGTAPLLTAGLFPILDPASHLYDYFRVLTAIAHTPAEAGDRAQTVEWATVDHRA